MPPDLSAHLSHLPLGTVEYYETIGSTNDLASERLASGAPDLTLIISDEQTAGRGRQGRSWHTPRNAALAFSAVLRTPPNSPPWAYAPLGALAVHDALADFGLKPAIKWPNDVLISGKKVCGVLAEAYWQGTSLLGVVLGIGINILPEAVPAGELLFPATSVAEEVPGPVNRWHILTMVLEHLIRRRARIGKTDFLTAWEDRLAYKGQTVVVGGQRGLLLGLTTEGSLRLQTNEGEKTFAAGEVSLRPEISL